MDFFVHIHKSADNVSGLQFQKVSHADQIRENTIHIIGKDNHTTLYADEDADFLSIVLGDPIYQTEESTANQYLKKKDIGSFVRNVDGFYFIILYDKKRNEVLAGSSLFGILPIYYADFDNKLCISSSLEFIVEQNKNKIFNPDKQYYLEKALFNYPFLDRTPLEQIKTIPSNNFLRYNGLLSFEKHTNISDYFVQKPKPWSKSLDSLSDVFIEHAKPFLPNERFCATLTGGLDGRTLVGLALSEKKDFYTYSYGLEENNDVKIPRVITESLRLEYHPFIIDEHYAQNYFWNYGNEFLINTFGLGNISRSHYAYSAKKFITKSRFLISGNFGSEIIRSMKIPGVMTSQFLFDIFEHQNQNKISSLIKNWPGINYLSDDLVSTVHEKLADEIDAYLGSLPSSLTTNQKFYIYLYEQVFPKYFGPEIMFQRKYFNHRAPFLSFKFIEELLKTEVAGANSDFQEKNPLKRYHGQVLYSHVLRKTEPALLSFMLDKNYKPKNFLSKTGPLIIALGFFRKKFFSAKSKPVPNFSIMNVKCNKEKFEKFDHPQNLVSPAFKKISAKAFEGENIANYINIISSILYYFHLEKYQQ